MPWLFSALLVLLLALVLLKLARLHEPPPRTREAADDDDYDPLTNQERRIPAVLERYFQGMAFTPRPLPVWLLVAALGGTALAALLTLPPELALLLIAVVLLCVHVFLQILSGGKKRRIVLQLPSFLNQVTHRLSAGISVEHAFTDSVENLQPPLDRPMKRIMQRNALGMELHSAFAREAHLSRIREFSIIASAIRINEQFGGSIRSILQDIIDILRLDDLSKRELKSQTGETRVSALVLAGVPVLTALTLIGLNPEFLLQMWEDGLGRNLLVLAALMQLTGVILLWRMVRTV